MREKMNRIYGTDKASMKLEGKLRCKKPQKFYVFCVQDVQNLTKINVPHDHVCTVCKF